MKYEKEKLMATKNLLLDIGMNKQRNIKRLKNKELVKCI